MNPTCLVPHSPLKLPTAGRKLSILPGALHAVSTRRHVLSLELILPRPPFQRNPAFPIHACTLLYGCVQCLFALTCKPSNMPLSFSPLTPAECHRQSTPPGAVPSVSCPTSPLMPILTRTITRLFLSCRKLHHMPSPHPPCPRSVHVFHNSTTTAAKAVRHYAA